jgi:hypothetical protein
MNTIRRPGASSAAVLLGLSASFAIAHVCSPEWSHRTGLDVWNYSSDSATLRDATEMRAKVVADGEAAAQRRVAANQIASELASGAITLSVATDEVMEVFQEDPAITTVLEGVYRSASSERHRFACHMIERVRRFLEDDPERLAAVAARLQCEYEALSGSPDAAAKP